MIGVVCNVKVAGNDYMTDDGVDDGDGDGEGEGDEDDGIDENGDDDDDYVR